VIDLAKARKVLVHDSVVLTIADVAYLLKRGVEQTRVFRFDMVLRQAQLEEAIDLRDIGQRFAIFFTKEEIPLLRVVAKRHFFRMLSYTNYQLIHLKE